MGQRIWRRSEQKVGTVGDQWTMQRYLWILAAFAVTGFFWIIYLQTKLPPGVEAKGPTDNILPWVTLASSIISLMTGLVGLLTVIFSKLVEFKARRK